MKRNKKDTRKRRHYLRLRAMIRDKQDYGSWRTDADGFIATILRNPLRRYRYRYTRQHQGMICVDVLPIAMQAAVRGRDVSQLTAEWNENANRIKDLDIEGMGLDA